jgi:hypothetical protein
MMLRYAAVMVMATTIVGLAADVPLAGPSSEEMKNVETKSGLDINKAIPILHDKCVPLLNSRGFFVSMSHCGPFHSPSIAANSGDHDMCR